MIEGKGLGGKKVNRVNLSLSNQYTYKLNRLATSCNMKPTTLAAKLIEQSLDDEIILMKLQDEFNTQPAYRVRPMKNYKTDVIEYIIIGG